MSMPIDDTELFKNSIKYLYNLSTLSALNVPALESIFTTKRRLMEGRKSTFLPHSITKMNQKCQRCLLNFSDGPANYRIRAKKKRHKFANKISAKLKSNSSAFTKYQRRYLKRMNNLNGNQLVTTCAFCKKEHIVNMTFPKSHNKPNVPIIPSKKKKNKRDKFCGLNQEAVLSSTPQNEGQRNVDDSERPGKKMRRKLKISDNNKRPLTNRIALEETSKENTNVRKQNMRSKNLKRLGEFLNESANKKNSSVKVFYQQFLQSL